LEWVGLAGFEGRSVEGLSGGEQQRVALARTLAPEPRLVMLDEPLGALDRALRERLIVEIAGLLRSRSATALYVTHDHDEAGAVADRVALMREGRIVQTGTLATVRSRPADRWVADFVG
jgi:thiamine transport system ATP-binding protein